MHFGLHEKGGLSHNDAVLNMIKKVAESAKISFGQKVLDAGCGIGGSCLWIAENMRANAVGLNIQPMQLEIANAAKKKKSLDGHASFIAGDFCAMGLKHGTFDAVIAIESMCHAPDRKLLLDETARILKPGGRLAITNYYWAKPTENRREKKMMDAFVQGWALSDLDTPEGFQRLLNESKFQEVEKVDLTDAVRPSLRHLWKIALLSIPFEIVGRIFRFRNKVQFDNTIASINAYRLAKIELFSYFLFTAIRRP